MARPERRNPPQTQQQRQIARATAASSVQAASTAAVASEASAALVAIGDSEDPLPDTIRYKLAALEQRLDDAAIP